LILKKIKAQALTEFVVLVPILLFIAVGVVKLVDVAFKAQKLEMASYYAARLYSKHIVRGIKRGTVIAFEQKKSKVMNEVVKPRVYNYLGTEDVDITNDGNKIDLEWEIPLKLQLLGFSLSKTITLKASSEMENDPLVYGGGRNADD
jgi:hypothetical protein